MAKGPKLDGAGTIKLATLEEALVKHQSVHALVERMAIEVKGAKPINGMEMQLKRLVAPLQGMLKSQFSLIGDLYSAMLLASGRGSAGAQKIRAYRELVAQIRTQMEIAVVQTTEKHTVAASGGDREDGKTGR